MALTLLGVKLTFLPGTTSPHLIPSPCRHLPLHSLLLPVISLFHPHWPPNCSSKGLACFHPRTFAQAVPAAGNALPPMSIWLRPHLHQIPAQMFPPQGGPTLLSPHQAPATSCLVKYPYHYCPCKGEGFCLPGSRLCPQHPVQTLATLGAQSSPRTQITLRLGVEELTSSSHSLHPPGTRGWCKGLW